MEFKNRAKSFLKYLEMVKNVSVHTIRNYAIDLDSVKDFIETNVLKYQKTSNKILEKDDKDFSLEEINKWVIRSYLAHLSEKKMKNKTIMRRISSLRSFYRYLMKEKLIDENPMEYIESPKKEKKLPNALSYDQVIHLFNMCDVNTYLGFRDRAIMELFYSSGLRLSELVDLDRNDLDEDSSLLNVYGKGKKQRVVPVTKTAIDLIKKYLNHEMRFQDTKESKKQ
ncbi:MAG: site-specific integrase, partial [Parachlamydiales bacterium]